VAQWGDAAFAVAVAVAVAVSIAPPTFAFGGSHSLIVASSIRGRTTINHVHCQIAAEQQSTMLSSLLARSSLIVA
jgi:hypothetical protein